MKKFIVAFCLITMSSFAAIAQDPVEKTERVETLSIALRRPAIDKIQVDFIKDDKIELDEALPEKPEFKKNSSSIARQNSGDEYNKNEFFVGYSYQNVDRGNRDHFNGFNLSYVRNVSRYIGIKGDVSGAYSNDTFRFTGTTPVNTLGIGSGGFTLTGETKSQLYNFLGGVQFKDNSSDNKLKPFAHALAGAAHKRFSTSSRCSGNCTGIITGNASFSDTNFAAAFGGGLDIKITDKIDIRAIQFDYNPIFTGGRVENNFRIGVGFVFK